ncbi:MAG: type IV toxin-antitoxin system AbiEi family antitoxin domain-containing protein [Chlamydiota bacterium]
MKLDAFFAQHQIFTVNELSAWLSEEAACGVNHSTLHNSLAYHQKQGHILRIRRGLYYSIAKGVIASTYPVDPFLITSKMAEDAVLGYRTALDLYGKLHTTSNKFIYLSKKRVMASFVFRDIEYQAVSIPMALKENNNEQFGIQSMDRLGQSILVTTLERTLVDVLDRPHLCGSWEEIWLSLENIEYLDLDQVLKYAFLLGNATTIAKLGFFLETHRDRLMIPENYLEDLCKHRPMKPHYLERKQKQPQKMISKWNLIVPLSLINREWEEPNEDI